MDHPNQIPSPFIEPVNFWEVTPGTDVIMLGDTPDDIRAAVTAGCTGVGVTTPEAAHELAAQGRSHEEAKLAVAMKECGATVILEPGFEKLVTDVSRTSINESWIILKYRVLL
jgi:hypothetical protein